MSSGKDTFEQRVKDDLRKVVADTSPEVRARIARITALAMAEARRPRRRGLPALIPLGGVAAVAVVVVALQVFKQQPAAPEKLAPIPPDDVALLLNVDNLDLLEQMEFYLWLDREPGVLDAAGASAPEQPRRS